MIGSEFILKYVIESYPQIQDCINAVVLQMPCEQNLVDIIEKDMRMIKRKNIEQIRLFRNDLNAYVLLDSRSYQKGTSFQELLEMNKITSDTKEIKILIIVKT